MFNRKSLLNLCNKKTFGVSLEQIPRSIALFIFSCCVHSWLVTCLVRGWGFWVLFRLGDSLWGRIVCNISDGLIWLLSCKFVASSAAFSVSLFLFFLPPLTVSGTGERNRGLNSLAFSCCSARIAGIWFCRARCLAAPHVPSFGFLGMTERSRGSYVRNDSLVRYVLRLGLDWPYCYG